MRNLGCFVLIFISSTVILAQDPSNGLLVIGNRLVTPVLYKYMQNQTGNFIFSPLSLQLALLFVEAGCKDQTAQEILRALEFYLVSNEALANGTKSLIPFLTSCKNPILNIANGLFVQENYTIKEEFKKNATEVFYSKLQSVNFAKNVETAKIINSWVENQTKNKIQNLIDPGTLNAQTRLVLVNTLYFQGNWTTPFPVKYTKKGEKFYKTCNTVVEVDMMVLEGKIFEYAHCESLKAQILRLPIIGKNVSLVLVLPTERYGIANLEKHPNRVFTPRNLTKQAVNVKLPKFLIKSTFKMNNILQQMGVVTAFTPGKADLSGIAGHKGDLSVTDVTQKTYFQVSENGIEAAAATAAIVSTTSVLLPPPNPVNFTCDHPFNIYLEYNGVILFNGRVEDPSQSD